jgi:hypothetical protein
VASALKVKGTRVPLLIEVTAKVKVIRISFGTKLKFTRVNLEQGVKEALSG